MNASSRLLACVVISALIVSAFAGPALAQVIGGGGFGGSAGLMQGAIQWFTQNLLGGMIMLGVLAIGISLMFMRFFLGGIAMVVVGALIADNYTSIAAML